MTLAIEVGPQQVLTRLTRQIAGGRMTVLATDHPKRGTEFQLLVARAGWEVMTSRSQQESTTVSASLAKQSNPLSKSTVPMANSMDRQPIHFDATAVRRERMRLAALQSPKPLAQAAPVVAAPAVMQYDASQIRRQRNRTEPKDTSLGSQTHPEPQGVSPGWSTQPEPQGASPGLPAITSTTSPISASPTVDHVKVIESFLIDFVVEQTGYPAEIIELDWDIEADLGIDSIKKAQLFGELREFFDLESLTSFSLDSFKTLRHIVDLLVTLPGKGDWLARTSADTGTPSPSQKIVDVSSNFAPAIPAAPPAIVTPAPAIVQPQPVTATPQAAAPASSMSNERMQQFLIDFVVEQTGYPPEIVDLDSDLEADLGIDSIKKAQLFGELREMFTFPTPTSTENNRLALSDFRTLRSVLELLQGSQRSEGASASTELPASPSAPATSVVPVENQSVTIAQPTSAAQPESHTSVAMGVSPAHEFRSLVQLPLPATPFSVLGELPVAYFASTSDRVTVVPGHNYATALFANLQAMAGRPSHTASDCSPHYNGQSERVGHSITHLATTLGAAEISLLALDACVLQSSRWSPASASEAHSSSTSTAILVTRGCEPLPTMKPPPGWPVGLAYRWQRMCIPVLPVP